MSDDDQKSSQETKTESRRIGSTALKMLREHSGLVRWQLAERSTVSERRIGSYERGEQDIEDGDLRSMLEGMDLPYDAWAETVEHVERLDWLRSRKKGQVGTIADGGAEAGGSAMPAWVLEPGGGLNVAALRREVIRVASVAGRSRERETYDMLNLVLTLLATVRADE